ncbi:MAG: tetratricopeptide repeat protein [Chitinophagaceae bacterium]|nr:tetratricopeptide repeat protein [Chitinophagaceae bacterium]
MIKSVLSLLVTVAITGNLFAQKVEDGKKFFYYERYRSAKETFEKIIAADPNNSEAVYWLGQTLLEQKDSVAAKDLYQKALATNANAPLLLAGMGQILLMEGKKDEARQQFETAINLSKGKDIEVFNAVGRANVEARQGDPAYAIEKLTQATQIKKFNNPDTYMLMGNAYRKMIDGGNAITNYHKALELQPNLAEAKNNEGRIYETQKNWEFALPAYEEAVKLDQAYAPAYFNLFYYYYFRNVNKAGDYLNSYIANSDQGPETEYIKTDYTYAKGDFAGAKQRAQELINQYGANVNPRMYRMLAFANDTLGDHAAAKQAMDTFLAKSEPGPDVEDIKASDYEMMAKIANKIPELKDSVFIYYDKAINMDTVVKNKLELIAKAAQLAKESGNRSLEAEMLGQAYAIQKDPGATDLYNWAFAHYQAGNYVKADSLFCGVYQSKYPDQIFGYLWCARAKAAQDTTMEKALAVPAYKTLAQKSIELDTTAGKKYKLFAIQSNFYLVQYYNNVAKDIDSSLYYLNEVVKIDPTNTTATNAIKTLQEAKRKASQQPANKPKGTATAPKSGAGR